MFYRRLVEFIIQYFQPFIGNVDSILFFFLFPFRLVTGQTALISVGLPKAGNHEFDQVSIKYQKRFFSDTD